MTMDRLIEKKKWPLQRLAKYTAAAVAVLAISYFLVFNTYTSALKVESRRLIISTVQKGPFREFIPVTGSVLPLTTIYLDVIEGGSVEKIYTEAGAKVQKGDPILKLANTNLLMTLVNNEAQVNRAENELRVARLQLEQNRLSLKRQQTEADYNLQRTERQYKRAQTLLREKLISQQEFETAEEDFQYWTKQKQLNLESLETDNTFRQEQVKALETSVKRMQNNLILVRRQLENLTVRAPITGHLTSLDAEVGQAINRGDRLGQVDRMDGFRIRANIDEHFINRIATGTTGTCQLEGKTYELSVHKIYPEVREGEFQVDLLFHRQQPTGVKRGQTIYVRLQLGESSEAVMLARGGFFQDTGGNWAYILDASGEYAVKRKIKLGRQNPQFFEILEGLQPGDRVITSSYRNFNDIDRLDLY